MANLTSLAAPACTTCSSAPLDPSLRLGRTWKDPPPTSTPRGYTAGNSSSSGSAHWRCSSTSSALASGTGGAHMIPADSLMWWGISTWSTPSAWAWSTMAWTVSTHPWERSWSNKAWIFRRVSRPPPPHFRGGILSVELPPELSRSTGFGDGVSSTPTTGIHTRSPASASPALPLEINIVEENLAPRTAGSIRGASPLKGAGVRRGTGRGAAWWSSLRLPSATSEWHRPMTSLAVEEPELWERTRVRWALGRASSIASIHLRIFAYLGSGLSTLCNITTS
mmetsp:Transcript_17513/g.40232  ORF Transcript_17513/g.40232 Transcript_17513/m.40232 type:complete len:280 (+) Transcript_17513:279-1118(+)